MRALPDPASLKSGPSGTASLPPAWLATRSLPLVRLHQGMPLFRIHRQSHGAVFFGPAVDPTNGTRQPAANRFDSLAGGFGVLYVAAHFEGAFVETVLRNPAMRFVSELYVTLACRQRIDLRSRTQAGRPSWQGSVARRRHQCNLNRPIRAVSDLD